MAPTNTAGVGVVAALIVSSCLFAGLPAAVTAQTSTDDGLTTSFGIDDRNPESSVPTPEQAMRRPLDMGYHVMLLAEKAEKAEARGDLAAAARFWQALAKAAPDQALPHRRACPLYEEAGDYAKALESCRTALGKRGVTARDNLDYARMLLERKPGALEPSDVADIEAIANHLERELGAGHGPVTAWRMRCQLATRIGDEERLAICSKRLRSLAPNDPQTLVFTWSLALKQGDFARAEQLLEQARAANLPAAAIDKMSAAFQIETDRREPLWRRSLRDTRLIVGLGLTGLLAVFAGLIVRRRQKLRGA